VRRRIPSILAMYAFAQNLTSPAMPADSFGPYALDKGCSGVGSRSREESMQQKTYLARQRHMSLIAGSAQRW
ncbi:MAG: hypothetical protein ACXWLK_08460, partial [Rhizomicrobium sp.]